MHIAAMSVTSNSMTVECSAATVAPTNCTRFGCLCLDTLSAIAKPRDINSALAGSSNCRAATYTHSSQLAAQSPPCSVTHHPSLRVLSDLPLTQTAEFGTGVCK